MATDDCFAVMTNSLAVYAAAIGPRASVMAQLLGRPHDPLTNQSEFVAFPGGSGFPYFPELWIDLVHDAVGGVE